MWDNVDYCTFEEQTDFTPTRKRFYFVEEMKTQVASGVREFKFKIDKWFTRTIQLLWGTIIANWRASWSTSEYIY